MSYSLPAVFAFLEFRRPDQYPDRPIEPGIDVTDDTLSGIRCPLCKWRPLRSSRWTCWDCDYPEYFYNGCGTEWNTFETRGRCPTCSHQWKWTSCLSCWSWSFHDDWYESEAK